jgi:flavin reductase (DIM6/NTAB) family NADH-FMN oxidoreductase RutF
MDSKLIQINVKSLTDNVFKLLDNDWMLITAGSHQSTNTMTASWGGFGILWNKPVAICFIRPQRYTSEFANKSEQFTLSFFTEKYKDALSYCGAHSGRNVDKIKNTGLTPVTTEHGSIFFSEARMVLECRTLYADNIKADNFIKTSLIKDIYPKGDFHRFFIGEIISCLSSDTLIKDSNFDLNGNVEEDFS